MRSRQDARTLRTRLLNRRVCTTLCVRRVYTCTTPLGPALSSSHADSTPRWDAGCGLPGLSGALSTGTMARQGLKPWRGLPGASLFWGSGSAEQNLQEGIFFAHQSFLIGKLTEIQASSVTAGHRLCKAHETRQPTDWMLALGTKAYHAYT